jgi:two-component sensor histidine kinase
MPHVRLTDQPAIQGSAAIAPKIGSDIALDAPRFLCPKTGREVDSGIRLSPGTRLISLRVRCPICEGVHEWQVAHQSAGTVLAADHRANGARLVKPQSAPQDFPYPRAEFVELREQLLDELNHRLKNNLQILHGFLPMARRKTRNAEAREVLADTSRRIGAMGTAQQVFYTVHNSTDVSGQRFLDAVCANASAFLGEEVSINYEVTAGSLPKETAVPLALALNELLTNAAKYGSNERGRVFINVGLSQRPGEIELYVQDQGPGFNFAEAQEQSSGLGLVTMLAQRLKGTFLVEQRLGARCILRFPDQ